MALLLPEVVFGAGGSSPAQLADSKWKSPLLALISEGSAAGPFRNDKQSSSKKTSFSLAHSASRIVCSQTAA